MSIHLTLDVQSIDEDENLQSTNVHAEKRL
ncbi:unnamed protein product, partial [Rotaria sp. Silwood1]